MRLLSALLLCATLVGCESEAEKLERLQEEAQNAAYLVEYYQSQVDSLSGATRVGELEAEIARSQKRQMALEGQVFLDSFDIYKAQREPLIAEYMRLTDSTFFEERERDTAYVAARAAAYARLDSARTRATLAERELNLFLRGD